MSEIIKLVANDNLPEILLTLTDDSTGRALDLSDPTTSVTLKFRAAGSTATPVAIPCVKVAGGVGGQVSFSFPGAVLAVPAGAYEGEIEINFNGQIQTVFEVLKFKVRADF